ncbi:hypothetical protein YASMINEVIRUS_176 [Yasminevirus sp. GU-2018]|uniref:Uncharacterized protein n=1 Tax=Yasminevirus sp. GU-2018 TaxID=2420051 RepID=A0A5K0U8P5_9VIRU|nr:hypothetical protein YASMINEVIRUS_176 [Yasminevirus sp. GU-2018]
MPAINKMEAESTPITTQITAPIVTTISTNVTKSYRKYHSMVLLSITAGVVVLVSLAWNDVIQTVIKKYYPNTDDTITGKLRYALIITFAVILAQIYVFPYIVDTDKK